MKRSAAPARKESWRLAPGGAGASMPLLDRTNFFGSGPIELSSAGGATEEDANTSLKEGSEFEWTAYLVVKVFVLFIAAGLAEIGGGWLVWQAAREGKPWWWAAVGSFVLVAYGFIPTLQPLNDFGRLYAVYGGIFIGLCYAWARQVDGMRIDSGDIIGSAVAVGGACITLFWPRSD